MTKETKNYLVNSSLLSLLARKYGLRHAIISGRVCQPTDKLFLTYSTSRCYEVQEPHPQPPPISKVYPFLPPAAGGLRGVRGGGLRCTS
ncbi:hypothetical protein PN463_10550 [Dolichospermum circinale CS-537/03]|uniref:hypothetical protein n=1 Tax=Dolichospermum circinale TaxID=109265 RepID=UPI00232B4048|nr:hypothetical protein [Dolichospermum circinale]MDB9479054.1 hypothetical protein [Dolichospermum circinale CS-537/03]